MEVPKAAPKAAPKAEPKAVPKVAAPPTDMLKPQLLPSFATERVERPSWADMPGAQQRRKSNSQAPAGLFISRAVFPGLLTARMRTNYLFGHSEWQVVPGAFCTRGQGPGYPLSTPVPFNWNQYCSGTYGFAVRLKWPERPRPAANTLQSFKAAS